ncbi:MAG: PAS domain S-box protein [Proteobacteria bacterium]|nr:PAS domain S-box protein [Pseudomonadota bacterium]
MSTAIDKKQDDLRLRAAAERQIDNAPSDEPLARPSEELLHELQVHQVELEMQNEALRQAQSALAESRDRYVDLYEFAPVGYLTLGAEGMIEEINLTGATLLGRERKKLLQRRFTSLVVPKDQDRCIRHFLDVKQGDGQDRVEFTLQRGDSTVFQAQLDCMLQKDSAGGTTMRIALTDITERKQAEEALHESEETHRSILHTAMDGYWLVDAEGSLQEVSETYCRMSGYSEQELLTMHIKDMEAAETANETASHIKNIMAWGEDRFQSRHRRKDGSVFDVEVSAQYHPLKYGRFVVFIQDLTERRRTEAARATLEAQLRESQKMQALGTLAGGIAHDFNNVLATILGNVELARQDVGLAHSALESLAEISKASQRAKHLVDQILAFGRRTLMARQVISLAPVVEESAKLLRATQPAGVSLKVASAPNLPLVLADSVQIEQIVLNLCNNAWQAIEGQGRPGSVEIRLDAYDHAQEAVRGALTTFTPGRLQPGRYVCLTVRDNGAGMDEATRGHLFEPFFTTKPVGEGTGLGLAVVHGIAAGHQAVIQVQSTPGEGTTFRVYFPEATAVDSSISAEGQHAVITPKTGSPGLRANGEHVLYIDDDESIVFLMKRMLERKGFRVSGYTKQDDALAAVRADPGQFDLAVTDYNMPGMSGLELARALRQIRADLPIVMASGYITEELRAQAPVAGVSELVFKPDTVGELCDAVERQVRVQRSNKKVG